MKKSLIVLLILFIGQIFIGCSTLNSIEVSDRTKVYNSNYQSTLKAVVNFCNTNSFSIITIDKELGIINTNYKNERNILWNKRTKLDFYISTINETNTKVSVNVTQEIDFGNAFKSSWELRTMTESQAISYYNLLFKTIKENF